MSADLRFGLRFRNLEELMAERNLNVDHVTIWRCTGLCSRTEPPLPPRAADLYPMWRGQTVAVVFPTFNERDSIRAATLEYLGTGLVDELVVVNNNAAPGTSDELTGTGAREIFETE